MKINDYYRDAAHLNLNGSITALIPTILIVTGNLLFIKEQQIMLATIPFFLYSFVSFQLYLFRKKQFIEISRNIHQVKRKNDLPSLFNTQHLLVLYLKTTSSKVLLFFPDGRLAGCMKKYRSRGFSFLLNKIYELDNSSEEPIGFFKVSRKKGCQIEVYDHNQIYLGCLEKKKHGWKNGKKEFLDATGRYVASVEGSSLFMDEQVLNRRQYRCSRLRRGWMPVEWSAIFPDPNTPVLSFSETNSEKDKLLHMSLLINEYFLER